MKQMAKFPSFPDHGHLHLKKLLGAVFFRKTFEVLKASKV
jgi:hypothetical protein